MPLLGDAQPIIFHEKNRKLQPEAEMDRNGKKRFFNRSKKRRSDKNKKCPILKKKPDGKKISRLGFRLTFRQWVTVVLTSFVDDDDDDVKIDTRVKFLDLNFSFSF